MDAVGPQQCHRLLLLSITPSSPLVPPTYPWLLASEAGAQPFGQSASSDFYCTSLSFSFLPATLPTIMEQVAEGGGGCLGPGDTQGQAGWGSEHPIKLPASPFIAGS